MVPPRAEAEGAPITGTTCRAVRRDAPPSRHGYGRAGSARRRPGRSSPRRRGASVRVPSGLRAARMGRMMDHDDAEARLGPAESRQHGLGPAHLLGAEAAAGDEGKGRDRRGQADEGDLPVAAQIGEDRLRPSSPGSRRRSPRAGLRGSPAHRHRGCPGRSSPSGGSPRPSRKTREVAHSLGRPILQVSPVQAMWSGFWA